VFQQRHASIVDHNVYGTEGREGLFRDVVATPLSGEIADHYNRPDAKGRDIMCRFLGSSLVATMYHDIATFLGKFQRDCLADA